MAENSPIEWTDHTWSPWEGCTKVGPGCDHCYAEGMNRWLRKGENWGPGAPRREYSDEHWAKPLRWNKAAKAAGVRRKVFPSVCDPFDNAITPEWRARFFDLIDRTSNLDWLLLTKRIGNAGKMLPWTPDGGRNSHIASSELWPNVWLGATVVNQEEADRDIPKLLAVPARVRFLSMEPLLGPVNIINFLVRPVRPDWVIVGGESGPKARPMHADWARSLRDQCAAAGVPFLFKQWGEWGPDEGPRADGTDPIFEGAGPCMRFVDGEWQTSKNGFTMPTDGDDAGDWLYRLGKKRNGRLLDGVTHDGFPEVAHA